MGLLSSKGIISLLSLALISVFVGATAVDTGRISHKLVASGQVVFSNLNVNGPTLLTNVNATKVSAADGASANPSFTFTNETGSGLYRIGSHHWGLGVNGVEALDIAESTSGYGNLGNPASVSDAFPFFFQRDLAGTFLTFQLSNPDSAAGSGAQIESVVDSGNDILQVNAISVNSTSPDAYNGGGGILRATGNLPSLTLIADSTSSSAIKMYAGGTGSGNKIATVNSSGLTLNSGVFSGDGSLLTNLNVSKAGIGTLSIAYGGTGQTSAQAAFDALSPLTGAGDILTYGSGHNARLGTSVGQLGYFLASGGAIVSDYWSNDGEYLANVNASKIQSVAVASTSPAGGQFLSYNGTAWAPFSFSSGDLNVSGAGVVTVQGIHGVSVSAATPSNGQVLTYNSSASKWQPVTSTALTNPMTTTGDMIYSSDNSGTPARVGVGTTTSYLGVSGGIPAWLSFTKHKQTIFTSTGTQSGLMFVVSGVTTAPTNGATYTNNGNTFTVLGTTPDKIVVFSTCSTCTTSGSTLTKSTGTGDSSITFSATQSLATFNPGSTDKAIWIRQVGGGGGGGGTTGTGANQNSAGGGGSGGGYTENFITTIPAHIYYTIGTGGGGGSSSGGSGSNGTYSGFATSDGATVAYGGPGIGGPGAGTCGGTVFCSGAQNVVGGCSGGDVCISGGQGCPGLSLQAGTQGAAGGGGGSALAPAQLCFYNGGTASIAGSNYGQGGGGGEIPASTGGHAGSGGGGGVMIIHELFNGN